VRKPRRKWCWSTMTSFRRLWAGIADSGAVDLHDDIPGNLAMDIGFGHEAELSSSFAHAACIVEASVELPRVVANPMEPRSAIANS
jgi:CO/xanthine dehydrogenase Mo-binding subunit